MANKVNKTTPQGYELPVVSGMTPGTSELYKNQFGEVNINASVQKSGEVLTSGEVIAVLPEGFRPKTELAPPCTLFPPFGAGHISIYPDGRIAVLTDSTTARSVFFSTRFLAQ